MFFNLEPLSSSCYSTTRSLPSDSVSPSPCFPFTHSQTSFMVRVSDARAVLSSEAVAAVGDRKVALELNFADAFSPSEWLPSVRLAGNVAVRVTQHGVC